MIIISSNVKGLGDWQKRALVKTFLLKDNPPTVILPETKLNFVDRGMVKSLWRARHIGWSALDATRTSGGS